MTYTVGHLAWPMKDMSCSKVPFTEENKNRRRNELISCSGEQRNSNLKPHKPRKSEYLLYYKETNKNDESTISSCVLRKVCVNDFI